MRWWIVTVAAGALLGAGVSAQLLLGRSQGDGHRAVLYEGVTLGFRGGTTRVDDDTARSQATSALSAWRAEIRRNVAAEPQQRFENPSRTAFDAALQRLARRYRFEIVSARVLEPGGRAPAIIVRSSDYVGLARAAPVILRELNPKLPTGDDRTGWRWEGFSFEAVDERGVPFLATFDGTRGHVFGGQWARSDALFPFAHG
jgi:hypothetical protein